MSSSGCCVLATDLDGTFIPLDGDIEAERSLRLIKSALASPPTNSQVDQSSQAGRAFPLLFVTGRHYDSVLDAIRESSLPIPDWILCDVGTSFFRRVTEADQPNVFERVAAYDHELASIASDGLSQPIRDAMAGLPGFRLQEPFKQGMHKLSFYVPQSNLEACHSTVEAFIEQRGLKLSVVSSVDPFNGDGLVDVLPKDVSKAFALRWWCEQENLSKTNILFCGDSGNDFAALVDGYNAVVVGNADRALAREVQQSHRQRGWNDRLFLAEQTSTGGVLEAMRWFGMLPAETNQCTPNNISSEPHSNDAFQDFAFGAVPTGHRRVTFGLWAPEHQSIEV
ncbi:MAG: HAD-IIB family hydrolase, partial [Planctomycetota bacterium]